jgi:hypothetical protein
MSSSRQQSSRNAYVTDSTHQISAPLILLTCRLAGVELFRERGDRADVPFLCDPCVLLAYIAWRRMLVAIFPHRDLAK